MEKITLYSPYICISLPSPVDRYFPQVTASPKVQLESHGKAWHLDARFSLQMKFVQNIHEFFDENRRTCFNRAASLPMPKRSSITVLVPFCGLCNASTDELSLGVYFVNLLSRSIAKINRAKMPPMMAVMN